MPEEFGNGGVTLKTHLFSRANFALFATFSNSSGLESVFEKLRFHDGLVWTIDLTGKIKLRFRIPPV